MGKYIFSTLILGLVLLGPVPIAKDKQSYVLGALTGIAVAVVWRLWTRDELSEQFDLLQGRRHWGRHG